MPKDLLSIARATKYPSEAFDFVQRGLEFTVQRIHGPMQPGADVVARHITGQQLCLGLRDYAMAQYGLMARPVLRRWQVTSCADFGHIVFAMVEAGVWHKTEEDSINDFVGVFDFAEAFVAILSLKDRSQA